MTLQAEPQASCSGFPTAMQLPNASPHTLDARVFAHTPRVRRVCAGPLLFRAKRASGGPGPHYRNGRAARAGWWPDRPLLSIREREPTAALRARSEARSVGTDTGGSRLVPHFPSIHSGLSAYFPPIGRIEVGKPLQTVSAPVRPCPPLAGRIPCIGRTSLQNGTFLHGFPPIFRPT
jgi:hypothetical protein